MEEDLLVGLGGPSDATRIRLATSKNKDLHLYGHPGRAVRSLSAVYNCIGMVFANRRAWVEPEQVPMILADDSYYEIKPSEVVPGDIVVYFTMPDVISHVAVAVSNEPELSDGSSNIRVLSQWGRNGEYFHDYRDVPHWLGTPVKFYSERRRL
jgi:hypothetical protein